MGEERRLSEIRAEDGLTTDCQRPGRAPSVPDSECGLCLWLQETQNRISMMHIDKGIILSCLRETSDCTGAVRNPPVYGTYNPSLPTWSAVHPESHRWSWTCCAAGRSHQDGCARAVFEGFLLCRLFILIPVHIGKAPEKGVIAKFLCHREIFGAVFALRRAIEPRHLRSGDFFEFRFDVPHFLLEGFL